LTGSLFDHVHASSSLPVDGFSHQPTPEFEHDHHQLDESGAPQTSIPRARRDVSGV
jgi:hypothetical protein